MKVFRSQKEALHFLTYIFRAHEDDKKETSFQSPHMYVDRARYLYQQLGNPQRNLQLIHIAGTSGKGSCAHILSALLSAHQHKTATYTSPHLFDYRERFVINGTMISEADLTRHLNTILPLAQEMENTSFGKPSFFEISNALAYNYFSEQKVLYAIIESHVGGMNDSTNTETSPSKISLLTEIGFDHQNLLGTTLKSIAYQKAGIINNSSQVFAISGKDESNAVIADVALARGANIQWTGSGTSYTNVQVGKEKTTFDYIGKSINLKKVEISVLGEHQVRNASLSLVALEFIAARDDWKINEQAIRECLQHVHERLGGRIEYKKIQGKSCYFDVAHNEQKLQALVQGLCTLYPQQKFTFVVAFKHEKEFERMIDVLAPHAAAFLVTSFTPKSIDTPFYSIAPNLLTAYIHKYYPTIPCEKIENAPQAFQEALHMKDIPVVTGSFYLVSEILQSL